MPGGVELRLGADTRRTTGESRELASYVAGEPTRHRAAGGDSWTAGAFAEASGDLGERPLPAALGSISGVSATGICSNRRSRRATCSLTPGSARERLAADRARRRCCAARRRVQLRSAAYLGWRMPTLNELFRPFRAGTDATAANPDLDPERLAGAEAGIDYAHGPFSAFADRVREPAEGRNRQRDAGAVGLAPSPASASSGRRTFRQRQNVDAVKVRGVEASAGGRDGPWSCSAGASVTHARMEASGAAAVPRRIAAGADAELSGTLALGLAARREGGADRFCAASAVSSTTTSTRDLLKAATTLDAFASWPLTHAAAARRDGPRTSPTHW